MTTFTSVRNLNRHVLEHMRITNPVKTIYSLLKMVVSTNLGVNVMGEKLEDIFNYLQISDLIATSGQPTESQIAAIKEAGYQVLINLALERRSYCLTYTHLCSAPQFRIW